MESNQLYVRRQRQAKSKLKWTMNFNHELLQISANPFLMCTNQNQWNQDGTSEMKKGRKSKQRGLPFQVRLVEAERILPGQTQCSRSDSVDDLAASKRHWHSSFRSAWSKSKRLIQTPLHNILQVMPWRLPSKTRSVDGIGWKAKESFGFRVMIMPVLQLKPWLKRSWLNRYLTSYSLFIDRNHTYFIQGKTREDLGRDTFCQEVFKWKDEKQETISKQLEGLGASLDWSRECFTMSSTHTRAVETAFKTFYDKGLIYRDKRLVNWSCALKSSISDIEVDHLDIDKPTKIKVPGYAKPISFGSIFDVAYQVAGESRMSKSSLMKAIPCVWVESRERLVVSTTRPETLLGDVAVAVHPDDARYQHLIGRTLLHPLGELSQIPVVADESVDKTFGTGAVKVTPAHDFNDFERGLRHKLPVITVFNKHGRVVSKHPEFNVS